MPDYALMNQYLYEGNAKEVEQMTKDALADGRPVQEVLTEGLIAGMSVVGEDFKRSSAPTKAPWSGPACCSWGPCAATCTTSARTSSA